MRKIYLTFLLGCLLFITSFGQQALTSTSSSANSGSFVLDWSVGELTLVNTLQNGNLIFTNGVLQGKLEAFSLLGNMGNGEVVITPNPTASNLFIRTTFLEPGKFSFKLYDIGGRVLKQMEMSGQGFNTQSLNMSFYASGTYLLQAVFKPDNGEARKQTYKIAVLR